MKILFIGGTGNISLTISEQLIQNGHELWLLNRHTPIAGGQHIACDIHNEVQATEQLKNHEWDVVVNWVAFTAADIERDVRLFAGRVGQYIFISSASCYQNPGNALFITEDRPLANPYWQYSRDKIAAEYTLMQAHQKQQFPATIVRPSHTYSRVIPLTLGGWTFYNTIARMKQGKPIVVQGDGTSLWTLTHADDFAKGFIGLLAKKEAIGEAFHITSDEVLDWNTIYQQTAAALNVEAQIVHVASDAICKLYPEETGSLLGDKAVSALFDNRKIKSFVPSFEATIPYAQGIATTLAWFESEPSRQNIDAATEQMLDTLVTLGSNARL